MPVIWIIDILQPFLQLPMLTDLIRCNQSALFRQLRRKIGADRQANLAILDYLNIIRQAIKDGSE